MRDEAHRDMSKSEWIDDAQKEAGDFEKLRKQNKENAISNGEKKTTVCKEINAETEWGRKARKYISVHVENQKTSIKIQAAAKLSKCSGSAKERLIAAIELAQNGFIICSISGAMDIVKSENIKYTERLEACIVVLAKVSEKIRDLSQRVVEKETVLDWKYTTQKCQRIAKTLSQAIDAYKNEKIIEKIKEELNIIMSMPNEETGISLHKDERMALKHEDERSCMVKNLSTSHKKPIIRSIHHLACTGGTIISKCIASMPNVALISEVNPMNRSGAEFSPSNPLLLLERSYRNLSKKEIIDIFRAQIKQAFEICVEDDVDLVLRDHSHTDFHTGMKESKSCAIKYHLKDDFDVISIATVRHPLDSYLSLVNSGWEKQFSPSNFNEYNRRYLEFIKTYETSKIIRYEDFCEKPKAIMKQICSELAINYDENFIERYGEQELTGDSGRKDNKFIGKRARRKIPKEFKKEIEESTYYKMLVEYLSY